MAIIITKQGKNAKKIDKSEFEYEDNLQQYIDDNPESIPLYEIKEDIRVLVLCREFSTSSGPIDALGIDRDGDIYIIETKLFKNADKRKVVAQALDYGAALWKSTIDFGSFLQQIDTHLAKKNSTSTSKRISEFFEAPAEEVDFILEQVRDNLNHGNFKFIILMDELDSRLKDLILFVNENSKFDLYAVEFEYYKHEDFEIVIPKLFGAQVRKDPPPPPPGKHWTEEEILESIRENVSNQLVVDAAKQLLEFAKENSSIDPVSPQRSKLGSFGLYFVEDGVQYCLFSVGGDGSLRLYLLQDNPEFVNQLRERGLQISETKDQRHLKLAEFLKLVPVDDFINLVRRAFDE